MVDLFSFLEDGFCVNLLTISKYIIFSEVQC
jgi:hypothetical protein